MKRRAATLLVASVLFSLAACTKEEASLGTQGRLKKVFESSSFAAGYRAKRLAAEGPFARLIIAKLGVDLIVAEGTSGHSLDGGAGHYENSAFPGEVGNVAIAGRRSGTVEPFHSLDLMNQGDEIVLIVPGDRYRYRVVPAFGGHPNPWVTNPRDLSTIEPTDYAALTLTTSDPPTSSKNRLILRLRLVGSESTD